MGNRLENINRAYEHIAALAGSIVSKSAVYVSPPWGFEADQDFYNTVAELDTDFDPVQLIMVLKSIEVRMGRVKTRAQGYESRLIDLDILDFRGEIRVSDTLQLPHPSLHLRGFVLYPLREICPLWVHPVSGKKIGDLIGALGASEIPDKLADAND